MAIKRTLSQAFSSAVSAYKAGKLVAAERICQQILNNKRDLVDVLHLLAIVQSSLGRKHAALASYDRVLTLRPDFVEALSNRGVTLHELKRFKEALTSYDGALKLRPDYAEALFNRGATLRDLKRLEEALASYDWALKLRPDNAEALSNRGATLHELRRFEEALTSYDRALKLRPDYAEAHYDLSLVLSAFGRLSESRAALEEAIRLAPRNVKYRRVLSKIVRSVPGDSYLVAIEQLARDSTSFCVEDRIELHFAVAKAFDDVGRHVEAFRQWLDGNALKRRLIEYDETVELGEFDRVRAVFTTEMIKARQNTGHSSSLPVFIIGMPRSGSTLVEQILASHPQVFGGGELKLFHKATADSVVFPEQVPRMTDSGFRDLGTRYLAEIERLAPAATRITDKMPGNFIRAGLIHLALPNSAIIHTVRDPIDTCLSCFSLLFSDKQNFTYDLAELGRYYRHYDALMEHWRQVLPPGRILDVRYEDVVFDLEGQARRIIAHCGLDWDARCLAFHQTERAVLTASAVQVRQPIYKNAIGRWRTYQHFLGPLLAELGTAGANRAAT